MVYLFCFKNSLIPSWGKMRAFVLQTKEHAISGAKMESPSLGIGVFSWNSFSSAKLERKSW